MSEDGVLLDSYQSLIVIVAVEKEAAGTRHGNLGNCPCFFIIYSPLRHWCYDILYLFL